MGSIAVLDCCHNANYNVPDSGRKVTFARKSDGWAHHEQWTKLIRMSEQKRKERLIAFEPATVGFLLNWWRRYIEPSQAQIHCLHFSLLFAAYITDDRPFASNSSWHVERIHIVCCIHMDIAWIDCVRIWRKNICAARNLRKMSGMCVNMAYGHCTTHTQHTHINACWLASRATQTMCQFQSINFAPNENPMWTFMTDKNARVIRLEMSVCFFTELWIG